MKQNKDPHEIWSETVVCIVAILATAWVLVKLLT